MTKHTSKNYIELIRIFRMLQKSRKPLIIKDCGIDSTYSQKSTKNALNCLVILGLVVKTPKIYKTGKGYKTARNVTAYVIKKKENGKIQ